MNYDKILIKLFFDENKKLNKNYKKVCCTKNTKYSNILQYIKERYNDSSCYRETIYRILFGIENRPVCLTCGKEVSFVGKNNRIFGTYCSNKCCANSKEKWDKVKNTNVKNWGTPGMYDSQKYREKLLKEKGYTNYLESDEFKEKRKRSFINHYGTDRIGKIEEILNKTKSTYNKHYGVDNPMLCDYIKVKRNKTLKANGTFNTSKPENKVYEILRKKFPDTIRSFSSEKYVFNCDFYIPNLDLYIECHFSHYHFGRPFKNSDNDKKDLELLQLKAKNIKEKYNRKISQYDKIIYTWTDLDVRKLNMFKLNELNYKIFYTFNDFMNWFELQ